jgi:hypothetical protein
MGFLEKMIFNEIETLPLSEPQLLEKREALYLEIIKIPAIQEALRLLDGLPTPEVRKGKGLPPLKYHVKDHTIDVIKETILFALADGVSRKDIEQQAIAAAWHDMGYLEQDKGNELLAVNKFENNPTTVDIDKNIKAEIIANILDTEISFTNGVPEQNKELSMLGYVLDADVSNFGRDDFRTCTRKIALEQGKDWDLIEDRLKLYPFIISLLENHTWKTESARRFREKTKQENLKKLKEDYEEDLYVYNFRKAA